MSECEQIDLRCCKHCLRNFLQLQISQRSRVKQRIHQSLNHSRSIIAEVKIPEGKLRDQSRLFLPGVREIQTGKCFCSSEKFTGEGNYCSFCRRAISFWARLSSDSDHSTR